MATLSELQAQLDTLTAAKRSGVLVVRHGDTQVTYRSMEDIDKAISDLVGAINSANGETRKPRYARQDTKGL